MKTVVVIPCRKTPDERRLAGVLGACGSMVVALSLPKDAEPPQLNNTTIHITRHDNAPDGVVNDDRTRYYANKVAAPLAKFAQTLLAAGDQVLWLHDNIVASACFGPLLTMLDSAAFASVKPRLFSAPGITPPVYDLADRCVAWRAGAFCKYATRPIPDSTVIRGTSIEETMKLMDADGVKYIWSDLVPEEV